jgi:hypothetical protein
MFDDILGKYIEKKRRKRKSNDEDTSQSFAKIWAEKQRQIDKSLADEDENEYDDEYEDLQLENFGYNDQ